jgi:hypothetical protein
MTSRLVVVETVSCHPQGQDPVAVESRFARPLATLEQPFVRRFSVGSSWQALPPGWLERASMLVLSNDEGKAPLVRPTQKEKQVLASRVVEVGVGPLAFALVGPGESCRFSPHDLGSLRVRCQAGEAKCTLTLIPE